MNKTASHAVGLLALLTLLAAPVHAQMGFGGAVAVSGESVLIGEAGNTVPSGIVYVYRQVDGAWQEVGQLTAADASEGDGFGAALLADGPMLLVSAVTRSTGGVYMLHADGDGNWSEVGHLVSPDEAGSDRFGSALAMGDGVLVVGAPADDEGEGSVYVYRMQEHAWVLETRLTGERAAPAEAADEGDAEPAAAGDEAAEPQPRRPERFGTAVAAAGDWIMVGAPGAEQRAGAAYAFRRGEGGWEQSGRVVGSGEGASLGSSLWMDGGEAMVGATGAFDGAGAVELLALDEESGEWQAAGRLMAFDAARGAFGSSLAVSGDQVFVGAPMAEGFQGRIYRFQRAADGSFSGSSKLGASGLAGRARLATSLAVAGNTLVAGVPGEDYGAGAALVMTESYGGWDRTKVKSAVHGLEPMTGHPMNCVDGRIGRFPCMGVELLSFLPVNGIGGGRGVITNDIWGWSDPETGKNYAIVGLTDRASFVDVTDAYNPIYVGNLPKPEQSPGSVWRDIKVYADHAFVVSDAAGEHGVQIFDLTHLREFAGMPITFDADVRYDQIASAHNIVINEATAFAYVVGASGGGETCGGGLHMINIEDPKNPVFAGCFADTRTGRRGTGYSHDAQCITYAGPDDRFTGREICFGSNETALSVADVTDKRNPIAIGMATYPNVSYTHQGWVTDDHRYLLMNDEGDEGAGTVEGTRTLVFDVQDLTDPILVTEYIHDVKSVDHNLYIVGNTAYESNYDSGLRLLDVSDPENPELVGYLDTVPWGENGEGMGMGSWSNYPFFPGIVVVTSGNEGIFVVRSRDAANNPNE